MPSFDAGQTGITPGVTILTTAGAVHTARATAGITEPVAGSGVYHFAHPDPGTLLLFVFDIGDGEVGASVWDDGVSPQAAAQAAIVAEPATLTAAYDAAKAAASQASVDAVADVVDAILVDTGTTLPGTLADMDTKLDSIAEDAQTAAGAEFGEDVCTLTFQDASGDVIPDAQVYLSDTNPAVLKTRIKTTDSLGQVQFDLTAGNTYYGWLASDAFTGTNPFTFIAVADE